MVNFSGMLKDISNISIDQFDGQNLQSELYILTHFHPDRVIKLTSEQFKERVFSNSAVKIFCTNVTKNLILMDDDFKFLKDSLVPLMDDVPFKLFNPSDDDDDDVDNNDKDHDKQRPITLKLIPAGHYPGSALCILEGVSDCRVMFVGSHRISSDCLQHLESIISLDETPRLVDSLYVNTSFFHPNNIFTPSHSQSLLCATEVIGQWIGHGRSRVVCLKFKTCLGYEKLLADISRHFNMKIHVNSLQFKRCSIIDIENYADLFTCDPNSTQIHACDPNSTQIHACDLDKNSIGSFKQEKRNQLIASPSHCSILKNVHFDDLRTLTFTSMFFSEFVTPDRYCIPVGTGDFKICYSLQPSYGEVCRLVEIVRPKRAFATATELCCDAQKGYDVQKELDRIVEKAHQARNGDDEEKDGQPLEKRFKRQFSEDSFANLKKISNGKRPRLESLSIDIHGSTENQGFLEEVTDQLRKRKRESSDEEKTLEGCHSKKIALEKKILQEHINKNHELRSHSYEALSYMSDENNFFESKVCDLERLTDVSALNNQLSDPSASVNQSENFDQVTDQSERLSQVVEQSESGFCAVASQSENSCQYISQPENSPEKSDNVTKAIDRESDAMINLCNDDETDHETRKEALMELNSSFHGANFQTSDQSYDIKLLCPSPFIASESRFRLKTSLDNELEGHSSAIKCTQPSNERVICIDLTKDIDDDDEEEEDDEEDDDVDEILPKIVQLPRFKSDDEEDDDCGYEGGDEHDTSDCEMSSRREAGGSENHSRRMTMTSKQPMSTSVDDNRTSGHDSDTSHFIELQRNTHARFQKLYRRKQRKIKIKTRQQNLRNVSKDDVIVIDDDTSDTDDSYDYDSGDSSSDYDHYRRKRAGEGADQFLMPSMSSSSESSQTLSSEDNVIVVVNCNKSPDLQRDEEDDEEARNGGEELTTLVVPPTPTIQNGNC